MRGDKEDRGWRECEGPQNWLLAGGQKSYILLIIDVMQLYYIVSTILSKDKFVSRHNVSCILCTETAHMFFQHTTTHTLRNNNASHNNNDSIQKHTREQTHTYYIIKQER